MIKNWAVRMKSEEFWQFTDSFPEEGIQIMLKFLNNLVDNKYYFVPCLAATDSELGAFCF